ncbi:MAG: HemK/PrmC family methyltransferase [Patescibacteria group bacterium]
MSKNKKNRSFSAYEKSHLSKHGLTSTELNKYGEMPVEYITGFVDFMGLELVVNNQVLIPRVETEELAEMAQKIIMKHWQTQKRPLKIADIGTGSGAIVLAMADFCLQKKLEASFVASDVSSNALRVAAANLQRFPTLKKLIRLEKSDLMSDFSDETFDLVTANLPYIPSGRIRHLDASVKDYEPWLALDGGEDGLKLISELIPQLAVHLVTGGEAILEVDCFHNEKILLEIKGIEAFALTMVKDSFSKSRFVILKKL